MRLRSFLTSSVQCGAVVAAVAALGLAAHQPWLFPSLAPTAVLQSQPKLKPSARPWNAVVGHCSGIVAGLVGVWIVGASRAPGVLATGHLTAVRLAAATIAIALTVVLSELLKAQHSPAASTTLLFAEGSYEPTGHDVLIVLAGIALTVAMGVVLRRMRSHATQRARWRRPPLLRTRPSGA